MSLSKELKDNYTEILREELVAAMGCTEPIAIAYAAATAKHLLGEDPIHMNVTCSGNIIKNVKGVTVPNSGNQKGIEVAAVLGAIGGDSSRELEVLERVTPEEQERCRQLVAQKICEVSLAEDVSNLYIAVEMKSEHHTAVTIISDYHTHIVYLEKDGEVQKDIRKTDSKKESTGSKGDKKKMTFAGIIEYADTVDLEDVRLILDHQIRCNSKISQEGLDHCWGVGVGKTILENWGDDIRSLACAKAAAGSDARMSGCPLPVIINSGSGNQGITVTMPVLVYAEKWHVSEDRRYRALLVSNLISIYIKHYIGPLSAFCGAVSAATGAGAAVTYLAGGDAKAIGRTITNTLANIGGIVCDGAKPSCAAKIASSVHAALLAHYMSITYKQFEGGEGLVEEDVEDTIRNIGYIGKVGMKDTDKEILNVMINKVDVKTCL